MSNSRKIVHTLVALFVSWVLASLLIGIIVAVFFGGDTTHPHSGKYIYPAIILLFLILFAWATFLIWRTKK